MLDYCVEFTQDMNNIFGNCCFAAVNTHDSMSY